MPSATTQEVCIELPGDAFRCFIGKDRLKIIVRKHRDVIFDVQLFKGASYTISAEQGNFFDNNTHRLIPKGSSISFIDGQSAHVWVGREFKGALLLKANGKVLGRYEPNALDATRYDSDPLIKPAPLLVTLHATQAPQRHTPMVAAQQVQYGQCTPANPSGAAPQQLLMPDLQSAAWADPLQTMMPTTREDQAVHIVEVISNKEAPPEAVRFFMQGGESVELDPNSVITRNWIISQLAGAQAYLIDNRAWAKELVGTTFRLQRVKHKTKVGYYIIFKGRPGLRRLMNASRYALENTKIVKMTAGAGSTRQAWGAAKGAAGDAFKIFAKEEGKLVFKAGGVAVLFTIGMDTAEWYQDYSQTGADGKPKKDFFDLLAKVGVDLVKAGLSAAIASVAVAAILSAAVFSLPALAVGAVVVGTIVVAIFVGYGLDYLDKKIAPKALGEEDSAAWFSKKLRSLANHLRESFSKEEHYQDYGAMFEPSGHTFGLGGA